MEILRSLIGRLIIAHSDFKDDHLRVLALDRILQYIVGKCGCLIACPEVIGGDAVFIVERHGEDALLDFGCSEEQDVEAVLVLPIKVSREYIVPVIRREGTEKEPGREGKDDQEQYVCDNTLRNNLHGFYSSSRNARDLSL